MMSKNSFLASLKENNKRRIWVWMVSSLLWFFFYPVGMALIMSREKNISLIDELTPNAVKNALLEAAGEWLSADGGVAIFVSIMAVICAIQGFSYLYSRKKVDLYHSVPVKKSRRFAIIYLNGVLIYLIPNAVSMGLAVLVAAVNGGMDVNNFKMAIATLGMNFVLYMGTYGLTVLAVMLTGNLLITLFGVGVFLFYEAAIRLGHMLFQSQFFDYYAEESMKQILVSSPMGQYIEMMNGLKNGGTAEHVCMGIFLAVCFSGVAYLCYRLRPSEAAGKTMAFARTKGIIKILIVVPVALMVMLIVKNIVGEGTSSTAPILFAMLASVVLMSCIMEVIYEIDIRAAFRKKYQILIAGACVAVIYCTYCFDLTGFDAWAPEEEELESAVVMFPRDYINSYIDSELSYIDGMEYRLSKPGIKDVEAISELSKRKVEMQGDCVWLEVGYRMKNGKTIWRQFPVSGEETELLDRIVGSSEYKAMSYQLTDDEIYQEIKRKKIQEITYSNGFRVENLATEDLDRIREAFLKDLEQVNYSTYREEFSCGRISIGVRNPKNRREAWLGYDLYPSYTNTIALLKEKGVYQEEYLNLEEIESITVTNYHRDLQEKAYQEALAAGNKEEAFELQMNGYNWEVHKTFTEEEQIRELANAIYPYELSSDWKAPEVISDDYYVTIQYKNGVTDSATYRGENDAQLITQLIPSWLEAETAYK